MPGDASLSFTIGFDHPVKVWVLQLGGWLPIPFTGVGIVLVDRNITAALDALADWPDRTDMEVEKWWLDQLNSDRFVLNPVLCASALAASLSTGLSGQPHLRRGDAAT